MKGEGEINKSKKGLGAWRSGNLIMNRRYTKQEMNYWCMLHMHDQRPLVPLERMHARSILGLGCCDILLRETSRVYIHGSAFHIALTLNTYM